MKKLSLVLMLVMAIGFAYGDPVSINDPLTGYTGTNADGSPNPVGSTEDSETVAQLAANGLEPQHIWGGGDGIPDPGGHNSYEKVLFDTTGAAFGTGIGGDDGRNSLRTIDTTYNTVSFELYVTINNMTSAQNIYIGIGAGVRGWWGIPDLGQGTDAVFAELRSIDSAVWVQDSVGTTKTVGPQGAADGTHRLLLAYDVDAQTVTVSVDLDYNGTFAADFEVATVSTVGLWASDQEARIYFGADDGALLTDLDIVSNSLVAQGPTPTNGKDLVDKNGVTLSWNAPEDYVPTDYKLYMRSGDPNFADPPQIIDGVSVTPTADPTTYAAGDLSFETEYFWRVDTSDNGTWYEGNVWSFTTKLFDAPPVVDAGDNVLTTLELAGSLAMGGSVVDDGASALTIDGWEAFEALGGGSTTKVTFADATVPDTTATVSEAGTYILKLTATDATGTVSDQKEIIVYADACEAAKATGEWTANYYDRDDDCDVDMEDFAIFAAEWLNSTALVEGWVYEGDFGDPVNALIADYWTDLEGTDPNDLLEAEDYPDTPDGAYFVTGELRGDFSGNTYGQRIYGYIVAPLTGDYTFYIASDDGSRLFLSSDTTPVDTNPEKRNQIAEVKAFTNVDTWDTEAGQTSAVVSLTEGQYYYIEVLHKEASGGDYVSVGWTLPGEATIEVIPGTALRTVLP